MNRKVIKLLDVLDLIDKISETDDEEEYIVSENILRKKIPRLNVVISNPDQILKDSKNPLESMDENEFLEKYKFTKEVTNEILQMILYGLKKYTNRGHPVPPIIELLITLRFLATGDFQSNTGDKVSQPTVSRIIKKITTLLTELKLRFIKFPEKSDSKKVFTKFQSFGEFPEVLGCICSTQIGIKCPGKAIADEYLNDNGYYSLHCQIITGPNLEFYDIISRWPGSTNENKIFSISEARQRFEYHQLEGVLLAPINYAPNSFVMTPIPNLNLRSSVAEWKYNDSHRKTYSGQTAIDLWKRRFKCLQIILNNKEDTTQNIITACAVLHNIARQRNINLSAKDEMAPITELKGKEAAKRKYPVDLDYFNLNDPIGVMERNSFVQKNFG